MLDKTRVSDLNDRAKRCQLEIEQLMRKYPTDSFSLSAIRRVCDNTIALTNDLLNVYAALEKLQEKE